MTTHYLNVSLDQVQENVFPNALSFHYEGEYPADKKMDEFLKFLQKSKLQATFMLTNEGFEKAEEHLDDLQENFEMGMLLTEKPLHWSRDVAKKINILRANYFVPKIFRYKPKIFSRHFRSEHMLYPKLAENGITIDSSDSSHVGQVFHETGLPVVVPLFNAPEIVSLPLSHFKVFGIQYDFFEKESLTHLIFPFLSAAIKHLNLQGKVVSTFLSLDWLLKNISIEEFGNALLPIFQENRFTNYGEVVRQARELDLCTTYRL